MEAEKLNRKQIRDLLESLADAPLKNYELIWVLEACLETPMSNVIGLGPFPWRAGLLISHRQCYWLKLDNEVFLEGLLSHLPNIELYRFFTTDAATLAMLSRWLPGGVASQSALMVRNNTQTWKKRFQVSLRVVPDSNTFAGFEYEITNPSGELVAVCSSQQVVPPWQEIIKWVPLLNEDYWLGQALGSVTALLLAQGYPVVMRVDRGTLGTLMEPLGYREFACIYYYITARHDAF